MKFIEIAATFIAMFAVAAVALPHDHGHHGYDHDGDSSSIDVGGCNNKETGGVVSLLSFFLSCIII